MREVAQQERKQAQQERRNRRGGSTRQTAAQQVRRRWCDERDATREAIGAMREMCYLLKGILANIVGERCLLIP
jgi:hypothetical protein